VAGVSVALGGHPSFAVPHALSYKFKFDGIFDMSSSQDEVFTTVAKEACEKYGVSE
jgi:hypothetical protein